MNREQVSGGLCSTAPHFGIRVQFAMSPPLCGVDLAPTVAMVTRSKSMRPNGFARSLPLLVTLVAGCGGSDGGTEPVGVRLGLTTEPPVTAAIGVALTPQPVIQIQDVAGAAVGSRGVLVTASIASGGGSLTGTTAVRTDLDGRAAFTDLALTGSVGVRTLRFSAQGLSAAISRAIDASAGPVSSLTIVAGNNQTVPAGSPVPVAPAVRVADGSGNPIAGAEVTFAVSSGGGSITGESTVTNAQGIATLGQWVLGTTVGPNTLSASVTGLTASVTFTATGVIGPATIITVIEGDDQAAYIGEPVLVPPTVKVTDASGNVIVGLGVNFVPVGGGTVLGNPAVTDANGIARLGGWRLGLVPGAQILNATRDGVSVSFSATASDFPVNVIAAGVGHSCAVDAGGQARCWGANPQGQLGNGTTRGDSLPVTVLNGTGFTEIAAGLHSCALVASGSARCWGNNNNGQLGDGTTSNKTSPAPVTGGFEFSKISVGFLHTCGLRKSDGQAYCWGAGANGRLGNGGTSARISPTAIQYFWSAISAGAGHTCGVRTDGLLFCWGQNAEGRIGDGTTEDKLEPTQVGGATLFTTVAAGGGHTCALETTGQAWCWGINTSGQLGDGTLITRSLPVQVGGGRTYTAITAGSAHTCALATDGTAWCWGENSSGGRVGDGTFTDRRVPTAVSGGGVFSQIRAGDQHTCARTTTGSAVCWGANNTGQLGNGSLANDNRPAGVKQP